MRQILAQEANESSSTRTGRGDIVWPKWINKVAWFLRITGVLILVVSTLAIIQTGWPHSLRGSGNLLGLCNGTLLFVLSFLYVTTGRTRIIVSVLTFVLGTAVLAFSAARLWLPHL